MGGERSSPVICYRARGMTEQLPGIKEDELVKLGACALCGKPMLGGQPGITFYRVTIERAGFDVRAIQQRLALQLQTGSAALARAMGPDVDLAKVFDGPHQRVVHEDCAHAINSLLELIPTDPRARSGGQTTRQMIEAPLGALYIWPNKSSLAYANALAAHLNRNDLTVSTPQVFDGDAHTLRQRRFSAIILDHATELSHRQMDVLQRFRALIGSAA
jgi:hypothetical protein